jgi:pimeloyl-ACP methyl ester carboxylesterase
VLLVCPFATPFLMFARVGRQLAADYFVVSHEPRGAPFMPGKLGPESLTLDRFTADVEETLARRGIESAHVVAWCSGVDIAARLFQNGRLHFKSLALITPGLIAKAVAMPEKSPYQETFLPLLKAAAVADAEQAQALFATVRALIKPTPEAETDRLIQRLATMNLRSAESFQAYGKLYETFLSNPDYETRDALIDAAIDGTPTLALHCRDDAVISYKCSMQLADKPRQLTVVVPEAGGHFLPFKDPDLVCSNLKKLYGSLASI